MENRKEIWDEIDQIKRESKSLQKYLRGDCMEYERNEVSLCPSKEFRDRLFKKCAQELGIEYDG